MRDLYPMKPNLDVLKPEIELYLEEMGMAVFYGYSRSLDSAPVVYWDCDEYPDYRLFVQAARSAGAKILVFHQRQFFSEQVDDALERLNACELPPQESRSFEERLNELRSHEGSVSCIELSFDHEGRIFLFDLRTEWFEEYSEMLDEIQLLTTDDDDEDDSPIAGYFSRN
jgi:hypothetical protein